jgi:hypothetical protein
MDGAVSRTCSTPRKLNTLKPCMKDTHDVIPDSYCEVDKKRLK